MSAGHVAPKILELFQMFVRGGVAVWTLSSFGMHLIFVARRLSKRFTERFELGV